MRKDNVLRALARGCTACAVLGLAGAAQAQVVEIVDSVPGTFMDISATGTPLGLTDDGEVTVTTTLLGDIRIGNNGAVGIGATAGDLFAGNTTLPSTNPLATNSSETYFVFWDDLDSDNGDVYWQEMADRVIVQWHNRPHFAGAVDMQGVIFQAQLFAPGAEVKAQYLYQDTIFDGQVGFDDGASATIGWQSASFSQWSFNTAGAVTSGDVLTIRSVPDVVGACCFPNGTCQDLTISECASAGGTHQGEGTACGTFTCPVLVPNDECDLPTVLSLGVASPGTTAGATGFDVASCGADEKDVWYAFLPEPNTTYRASTTGATDNVSIAVFQQECPPAGFELACGDPSTTDAWSYFTSDAIGSAVFIRVATDETGSADFSVVVDLAPPPPANDDCANAQVVNPGDSISGSNAVATTDGVTTCGFNGNSDVWFSLTPPVSGLYTIDTCGSDYDTTLAIFDGCGGAELACNDDDFSNCGAQSTLSNLQLVGGTTYFIRLAAYGAGPTEGNYTLTLSPAPIATGACCNGESCSVQSEADCLAGGGSYLGDDTSCGSTPNVTSSPNAAIPDATPTGFSDSITISDSEIITGIDVQVDVEHTWMGDVILTLQGPNGAIVDLVNRAGQVGGAGFGDSTELGAVYVFSDAGTQTLLDVAVPLGDTDVVPAGTYLPTTLENGVQSLNSSFAGSDAAGTWTLTMSDNAGGDTGTLVGWGLIINGGLGGACDAGPTCVCETDGDANQVNVFDLLSYLDLWFPSDAAADIDGTSGVNVFDLLFYLDCWFPASAGNPC